jgi:hypothetical protein
MAKFTRKLDRQGKLIAGRPVKGNNIFLTLNFLNISCAILLLSGIFYTFMNYDKLPGALCFPIKDFWQVIVSIITITQYPFLIGRWKNK